MPTKIDHYSLSTVPIGQYFNDTSLGTATGFVWERHNRHFLITNWHVVTGRNNETAETLAAHGGVPNKLRTLFHPREGRFDTYPREIDLYDADGHPIWLWHPIHKRGIDVIAIALLPAGTEWKFRPINTLPHEPLSVQVGMDVFVLGYPFGVAPPSFPVWKRGSIASEPELVRIGLKYHLVDTASRPGMSGAPVVLRTYGAHLTESGPSLTTDPATRFLGVYSGRLYTSDAQDAQLARVWPESFITEIIDANTRDVGSWT
jgi:hypothetical protein